MSSVIDQLLSDALAADGPRITPWAAPASACVDRTVYCDECREPAAGQCNGCGKYLCEPCLSRHRLPGPTSECSGRWNEPRADDGK